MTTQMAMGCALALALALGCQSKKNLDGAADALRTTIEKGDYDAFKKVVHPELHDQIPRETFDQTSRALGALGAFKERSMKSISVEAGKPSEGRYVLSYDEGDVDLELAVQEDLIVKFDLSGDTIAKALKQAAASGELTIRGFEFTEGKKGPKRVSTVFEPGEPMHFTVEFDGLELKNDEIHFRIGGQVVLPDGEVALQEELFNEKVEPEGGIPAATVTSQLSLQKPGNYVLRVVVRDEHAGEVKKAEQALVIRDPQ